MPRDFFLICLPIQCQVAEDKLGYKAEQRDVDQEDPDHEQQPVPHHLVGTIHLDQSIAPDGEPLVGDEN
jgi:hypothetical protein